MTRGPWWAPLIAALINWWTGRQHAAGYQQGRADASADQQEAADAIRKDYDEIHSDDRSLDDAVGGLRARAARRRAASDHNKLPKP